MNCVHNVDSSTYALLWYKIVGIPQLGERHTEDLKVTLHPRSPRWCREAKLKHAI